MKSPLYKCVLLKLSGEILSGENGFGIDPSKALYLANEVKDIHELGINIGLIIGAGNIFRGIKKHQIKGWIESLEIIWVCWRLL